MEIYHDSCAFQFDSFEYRVVLECGDFGFRSGQPVGELDHALQVRFWFPLFPLFLRYHFPSLIRLLIFYSMIFSLLFAGLLMNYDRVPNSLKWMLTTSFFHAGYEALLVNELRYLQLVERKFGLDIQVPSATSKLIILILLLLFFLPSFQRD